MYHRILFPILMADRAGATDHTKKLSEIVSVFPVINTYMREIRSYLHTHVG